MVVLTYFVQFPASDSDRGVIPHLLHDGFQVVLHRPTLAALVEPGCLPDFLQHRVGILLAGRLVAVRHFQQQ